MENENNQKRCPQCGKENPNGAQIFNDCNDPPSQLPSTQIRLNVKISQLASISFMFAICGLILLAPSVFAVNFPRSLNPESIWIVSTFMVGSIILVVSFFLGLFGFVEIERSGGKKTGRFFAVGAVLISVLGGLLPAWLMIINQPRSIAFRMVCGTNLAGLGKAMLIYAGDYDEKLPTAGGTNSTWTARIPNWKADNPFEAFDLQADKSGGQKSFSSSLYLLVKYCDVKPKSFVCFEDFGTTEFKPKKYSVKDESLKELWDFGPNPPKHCSYSYVMLDSEYPPIKSSDPGLAIAADRNPWIDSPFEKARDFQAFDPNGSTEAMRAGNTLAHKKDGQNVLFLDNHVSFEKRSFCGVNDDNIYTSWNGSDIRRGTPPKLESQPADRIDSLLVNDPALPK